ncbi:trypsin zeta-like [Aphidius gifuensis]|uniref:trypsin zeta-like n=1 Tax=Aphidius gifuensis TaxID=684658 RepID=UPI001CDD4890|nr:trypsin zeta-like [Aphidius gifuensis]
MMISITIIWIICISICDGNVPSKLYGGTRVEIGEHPYVVSLQWKGVHQCGGSIISLDTIITSASCVVIDTVPLIYQSNLQVLIGTNNNLAHHGNGLLYSIRYLIAHKNYDPHDAWINDLALLKGDSGNPIIFGQYIVGIISVSVPINSGNLIFTKIYSYKDWIQRFINSK